MGTHAATCDLVVLVFSKSFSFFVSKAEHFQPKPCCHLSDFDKQISKSNKMYCLFNWKIG